jgi:hypothetical protein
VVSWRTHPKHQLAQAKGREEVFVNYILRTGQLTHDTDLPEGCALSEQRLDETVAGAGNTAVLSTRRRPPSPLLHAARSRWPRASVSTSTPLA